MYKKIGLVLLSLVFLGSVSGCDSGQTTMDQHSTTVDELSGNVTSGNTEGGYKEVVNAAGIKLLFDSTTAGIAIDAAGNMWYSNPADVLQDQYASGSVQDNMLSQIILYYYNSDSELKMMSSYADSVKKHQYRTEETENGLKVYYTMGSFERGIESIPQQLTDARMNEAFLENDGLSSSEQKWIKKYYRNEDGNWYWKDSDAKMVIDRMLELMDMAGYTDSDLEKDNSQAGIQAADAGRIAFQVCIEYALEDGELVVTIPMEEFKFVGDVEPAKLEVLNYFGAAKNNEDGYIFVPDGSGALIYLENAGSTADYYTAEVYGGDEATSEIRLPVFGLKDNSQAFWAIIEKGDALASVNAYPSAIYSEYCMVYPSFILEKSEYVSLGDGDEQTDMLSFQNRMYGGDIIIRYLFLQNEKADYTGMAEDLQEYLIEKEILTALPSDSGLPLMLETIGGIRKTKTFLFSRYEGMETLTSFEQDREIARLFQEAGIEKLNIVLLSWGKGGFEQKLANKISPLSALGGKRGLQNLLNWSAESGVNVSGVLDLAHFSTSNAYTIYKYGARNLDQSMSKSENLDLVLNEPIKDYSYYRTSSGSFEKVIEHLKKSVEKYEDLTIMVSDLSKGITADYSKSGCFDRETAKDIFVKGLETLSESVILHMQGGNLYSLKYTDTITCAPQTSGGSSVIDAGIPFYSMVLHGYMIMSGETMNYVSDRDEYLLQSIESGFGLNACTMYAGSDEVKDTEYSKYYSAGIEDSFEWIVEKYNEINEAVGDLVSYGIIDHQIIQKDVRCVTYENGTVIYVNYSDEPVNVGDIEIQANSYTRIDK